MSLFNFKYEEYSIHSSLAKEELMSGLKNYISSSSVIGAIYKRLPFSGFFREDSFSLYPNLGGSNFARAKVLGKIKVLDDGSSEISITLRPSLYIIFLFKVCFSFVLLISLCGIICFFMGNYNNGFMLIFGSLFIPVLFTALIMFGKKLAIIELPKIKTNFATTILALERKAHFLVMPSFFERCFFLDK